MHHTSCYIKGYLHTYANQIRFFINGADFITQEKTYVRKWVGKRPATLLVCRIQDRNHWLAEGIF